MTPKVGKKPTENKKTDIVEKAPAEKKPYIVGKKPKAGCVWMIYTSSEFNG